MTTGPRDLAASIRQRLLNHARAEKIDFNYVLRRYANERFLYRLSRSGWQEQLILKGAECIPGLVTARFSAVAGH